MSDYSLYLEELDNVSDFSQCYCREKGGDWQVTTDQAPRDQAVLDVVLSAHWVTVLTLQPPKNYRKYGDAFLLNFVEPEIAQSIDTIALFPLSQHGDSLRVAVIDKTLWKSLCAKVAERGWQLGKVSIDALCLPISGQDGSVLAITPQRVLWHSAEGAIFSGDLAILEQTQAFQANNNHWLNARPNASDSDSAQHDDLAIKQLLTWAHSAPHNLHCQTEQAPSRRKTLAIASLAGLALLLWTLNLALSNRHQRQLADNYYSESVKLFHQVLPQYKKIPSRTYLKQRLAQLIDNQPTEAVYWRNWLLQVADAFDNQATELVSIDYRTEPARMTLVVKAQNAEALEALSNQLSQQLAVQRTQMTQDNDGMRATLEVTP